jgi:acyl-coenzyme A thioesterase PaaI-like protein
VQFRIEGEVCRAEFTPQTAHSGYDGLTHGGILFALLDDVMANWIWLKGEKCFTAKAEIRYREPLPIGTAVTLESRLVKRKARLVIMEGSIRRVDSGAVVAEATGSFMTRV